MPPKKPSTSEESYNRLEDAVWVPIKSLRPNPKNRNNHTDAQIERLAKLISTHGFRVPIIVSKRSGLVVAGHGRLLSAIKLGLKHVPVMKQDFSSEEEEYQFGIADNAIGEWSELDLSAINADLADLEHFDLELLGMKNFTADIAEKLEYQGDPNTAPALPKEPKSKIGDLWTMGTHRLLVGDAENIQHVERLMDGRRANMVFTDPPYGICFQSNRTEKKFDVLKNDERILTEWVNILPTVSDGFVFIWTTWKVIGKWLEATSFLGEMTNMIIWDKGGGGIGDLQKTFSTDYEIALVFHRDAKLTGKRIGSVWSVGKDCANAYLHPTQKPVELAEQALESCTVKGDIVLDLFGGSGSTLIACEKNQRDCRMAELDPRYADVILNRWAKFTGQDPIRDDGQSWLELNR